jgi:hypothetical protein
MSLNFNMIVAVQWGIPSEAVVQAEGGISLASISVREIPRPLVKARAVGMTQHDRYRFKLTWHLCRQLARAPYKDYGCALPARLFRFENGQLSLYKWDEPVA